MMTVKDHKNKDDGVQGEDELDHVPQGAEQSENNLRFVNMAKENILLAGISSTVAATSSIIAGSSAAGKVTESVKSVGNNKGVKKVLSSVASVYQNQLGPRLESVKVALNPTIKNMDDLACNGLQSVNNKVTEAKEAYVDPAMNKIGAVGEGTKKMYDTTKTSVSNTKENYVDPVVKKVNDIKLVTIKVYGDCAGIASTAQENYITPTIEKAQNVQQQYINPTVNKAQEIQKAYVDPTMAKVYSVVEDPAKVYGSALNYGMEVKEATVSKALETMDAARSLIVAHGK